MALPALDVIPGVLQEEAERAHAREGSVIFAFVQILLQVLLVSLVWCIVADDARQVGNGVRFVYANDVVRGVRSLQLLSAYLLVQILVLIH